jgi:hypothetical protein
VTTIFWNIFATGDQVLWLLLIQKLHFYTLEAREIMNLKILLWEMNGKNYFLLV